MFYKIYIELSDKCDLNCSFCTPVKNKRGIMDINLFSKIISEIKNKTRFIALHILGDPLKIKNLHKYLQICEMYKMKVDIVSSGLYLHDFSIFQSHCIHQVSFSLDALLDKNNAKIHIKNSTTYDAFLKKLFAFCAFRDLEQLQFYINFRMFRKDDNVILKILKHFNKNTILQNQKTIRLDYKIFLRFHNEFIWNKNEKNQNENEDTKAKDNENENDKNEVSLQVPLNAKNIESKNNKNHTKPYCHGAIKQLGILSNGIIVPCCICANAEIILGNICEFSLKDITSSKTFVDFKDSIFSHKNLHAKCQKCSFRGL